MADRTGTAAPRRKESVRDAESWIIAINRFGPETVERLRAFAERGRVLVFRTR